MDFEWDEAKAAANQAKHSVRFEEAQTVFDDLLAAIFDDEEHSAQEQREIIIRKERQEYEEHALS